MRSNVLLALRYALKRTGDSYLQGAGDGIFFPKDATDGVTARE
jgi:hypothetical protein